MNAFSGRGIFFSWPLTTCTAKVRDISKFLSRQSHVVSLTVLLSRQVQLTVASNDRI